MPKFDLIKVDDVLYDVHSYQMGSTTMRKLGWWDVRVIEVDRKNRRALCSWNGNPPKWYTEHQIEKLKRSIPKKLREELVKGG